MDLLLSGQSAQLAACVDRMTRASDAMALDSSGSDELSRTL